MSSGSKLAVQLYTVRDYTKTPEDIGNTLARLKEMGYGAVQLSALGPIEPGELKKLLDQNELIAAATHIPWDRLQNDLPAVVAEHRLYECRHVAVGSMPKEYRTAEGYPQFAKEASEIARRLADEGLTFSYHNHAFEFERFGERSGMQILLEESDPALGFEIDTYWVQEGGEDPAEWIRKVKGRIPIAHFKDRLVRDGKGVMAEVGEGTLDWPSIIAACKESEVEWYCIEQDICERNPFESLEISLKNCRAMGL